MALQNVGFVGPVLGQDGQQLAYRQDRTGANVIVEGGGKWQEANRLGQLWTGSTAAAGVNVPIYTSTTQQFVISNPSGSATAAIFKSFTAGYVSGAPVVGNFVICGSNVPSTLAPSGTAGLPFNNKTQSLVGSKMSVLGATITVVAATWFRPSISVFTTTAGNSPLFMTEELDGSIILLPGTWLAIAANAATFGTYFLSATWAEVPSSLIV